MDQDILRTAIECGFDRKCDAKRLRRRGAATGGSVAFHNKPQSVTVCSIAIRGSHPSGSTHWSTWSGVIQERRRGRVGSYGKSQLTSDTNQWKLSQKEREGMTIHNAGRVGLLIPFLLLAGCSKKDEADKRILEGLPQDEVYGKAHEGLNLYKDPIHGFFEVVAPDGFRIEEKRNKSTYKIPVGSPHAGEKVPCSRVFFKKDSVHIAVTSGKSFETDLPDMDKPLSGGDKSVTVHLARSVTIDGVQGAEIIITIRKGVPRPLTVHTITYLKNGLRHVVSLNTMSKDEYLQEQFAFIEFSHSYRGLKP